MGRGGSHEGPAIREGLGRTERLGSERRPAYAPDPDPGEAVGSWPKYGPLVDDVAPDTSGPDDGAFGHFGELKLDYDSLRALWDGSDLPFPLKG